MKVSTAKILCIAAACGMIAFSAPVSAQTFPSKPSRIIVPVSAGGLTDVLARAVAQELSRIWGQPVLVENRAGANHIIATDYVVKSAPDGYTMLIDDRAMIGNLVLSSSKLPYDSFRDLAPVANMIRIPNAVFVRSDFPANTLAEFVAYARANPGKINYGSFGLASNPHVQIEWLSRQFDIRLTHVPYKGIADVIPAVIGGQIQFAAGGVAALVPMARQGKIRVLALSGSKRSPLLPDVPTFAQAGAKQMSLSWTGFFVPAATPKAVIAKIAQDVKTVFSLPEFVGRFVEGVGLETDFLGPEQFLEVLKEDAKVYGGDIRSLNIKLD